MSKIKFCGIQERQSIQHINCILPDYIGFIFAPSRRRVIVEQANQLQRLTNSFIQTVGVFVNQPVEEVYAIARECQLNVIQLHGDEESSYIEQLRFLMKKQKEYSAHIWKAIRVQSPKDIEKIADSKADRMVLDSYSMKSKGGTGDSFDWEILQNLSNEFLSDKVILAGGLNRSNIEKALMLNVYALDVSSGIEKEGHKNAKLMYEFADKVRNT